MIVTELVVGLACGVLGGLLHLSCVAWRARLIVRGRQGWALALYPIGLLGPALAVLAAAWVAPLAAWLSPIGLVAIRVWALRPKAASGELSQGSAER
jgi:hypothetical protein